MNVKTVSNACSEMFRTTLNRLLTGTSQTAPDGFVLGCIVVREEAGRPEVRLDVSHGSQPRPKAMCYRLCCLLLMEKPPHHHRMAERVHDHQQGEVELHAHMHDCEYRRRRRFEMHISSSQAVRSNRAARSDW
jgi:hypothetical protein